MSRSLARSAIVALLAASLYAWRRHAASAPPHALEAEALLRLFSRAPPLPRDAARATAATIAAAATSRRPVHWPHCVPPEWSAKAWESPDSTARALARLVPWVMARALGSAEFVLSEPTRGARPLLRDASPWEAPLQQERRNVSVAQLLASESESLYYSGTLGEAATAHWRTEEILASLQPLDHLLLHDVPPLRKEEPRPPEGSGPPPANQTTMRLWISSKGVASRTHYDKSHNVFTQLSGRKRVLLWPPSSLPELHLYPAIHAAYRQSQIPLRAASGTGPLPGAAMAHYPRASATLAGRTAADAAVSVELLPGGCLYIPPYWAHAVLSVDASVSLSSFSTSWEQARWARSGWRMAPLGRFAASRCSRARGSVVLAQAFLAALLPHISHGASSLTTRQFLVNLHTSRFAPLYDGKREAAGELAELAACLAAPPSQGDPERDPALRRRIDEFAQSVGALLTDMDPEWGRSFDHGIVTELAGDYVEELLGWAGSAGDAQRLLQLLATDDYAVSIW